MNDKQIHDEIIIKCPVCTEYREMAKTISEHYTGRAERGAKVPEMTEIEINCSTCRDTGEVLTPLGEKLAKKLTAHLMDRIERMEDYASIANREASDKVGITSSIPF